MTRMLGRRGPILAGLATAGALAAVASSATAGEDVARDYVVVYEAEAGLGAARAAVADAGGRIVSENAKIGVATVRSKDAAFIDRATAQGELVGAAGNRVVGRLPAGDRAKRDAVEDLVVTGAGRLAGARRAQGPSTGDPLSPAQWDMQMIGATLDGSYRRQQGARSVRVGIIDTGVDGAHPDIRPNFNRALSRNFTTDIPLVDGACAEEADGSCSDPADVDENGHGTHVAGTVGSPVNGRGIAGVAPRVELVNLRAGQDSGYFFLQATVDALTFAGDNGIDVVNMSFYTDPWLYNCTANPADSPAEQAEQRTVIEASQRALGYARDRGVTLVAAAGNGHTDLGRPEVDDTSPDFPPDAPREREVDNSCLTMPTEGEGVIGVTAVGPTGRKAYYSDYGMEQADVAAPGGDAREFFGTPRYRTPDNLIWAPFSEAGLRADELLAPDGTPLSPSEIREEIGGKAWFWHAIQGTSMASPHAAGVAALIVAEYGTRDRIHGGLTLSPTRTEAILRRGATDTPCPEPRLFEYDDPALSADYNAYCEGDSESNGFFGDGIVNAVEVLQAPAR